MTKTSIITPCEREIVINAVDIGNGLSVYSRTTVISEIYANGVRKELSSEMTQGVVDAENLEWLELGETGFTKYVPPGYDAEMQFRPAFVTEGAREIMRTEGNPLADGTLCGKLVSAGMFYDGRGPSLVALAEKGMAYDDLIFISHYNHGIVQASGRPLPVAQHFDYMNGSLEEETYDLERVCAILTAHPEVTIVTERYGGPISEIPSYNAQSGCSRHIMARWAPTDESWSALLVKAGYDPEHPKPVKIDVHMALRKADVLGIEAARVVKSYKY